MTSATPVRRSNQGAITRETLTLRRSPATNLAGEVDLDDLGALQLPRDASHDINRIGTTDTARNHAETAGVGGVRVGTDHETAGEGVVLEDDLVDDTRARPPETETVLESGRSAVSVERELYDIAEYSPWQSRSPKSCRPPC